MKNGSFNVFRLDGGERAKTRTEVKGGDAVCFSLLTPIKRVNVPIYRRSQTSP